MLTSSNFKSNKNKQLLVIFSMASLFLFGLTLKTEAKVISVGTTTDTIYMGGSLGIGLTNPNSTLDVRNAISGDQLRFGQLNYTYSLGRDTSSGFLNFKGTQAGYTGYDFLSDDNIHLLTMIDNGNVGIGATTPYANLQIGQSAGGITFSSPSKIKIIGSPQSTTDEVFLNLVRDRNPGNQFAGAASFRLNSFAGGTGGAPPTSQLTIALKSTSDNTDVANVDVMTLRDNGNVGIGATAPGTKLDIAGAFRNSLATTHSLLGNSGNVVVMADNTGALYTITQASLLSGASNFWGGTKNGNIWNGDAGAGNVGIGTTAPGGKLAVSGNALIGNVSSGSYVIPSQLHIGGNSVAQISMEDVGVATAGIALDGNNLVFGHQNAAARYSFRYSSVYNGDYANSGTDIAWLQSGIQYLSGNVGIGVTNPGSYKLNVAGDITGNDYIVQNGASFSNLNAPSLLGAVYGNDILQDLFAFNAPNSYEVYNGSTWTAGTVPSSVFDGKNSQAWGDLVIPHDTPSVRFTWNSFGYRFWDALAFVHSTNGNSFSATLQWSTDGVNFTDFFTTPSYSSWPGYSVYKSSGNNSGKTPYLRLVLNFAWGANSNSVNIGAISMPGSYGGFTRLFDWDYSRNVTFPASLTNSLATKHSLLGGAGNTVVMADNTGTLYSTPLATFMSSGLWGGTKNGNIWNGDAGAGNVGIGTTAPGSKLTISGGNIANYTGFANVVGFKMMEDLSGGNAALRLYSPTGGSPNTQIFQIINNRNRLDFGYAAKDRDTEGTGDFNTSLSINSGGNVGVGTTGPFYSKFQVAGDITNNIGYKISPSAEDIGAAYLSYTNSGDIRFNMYGYYGHSLTTRSGTGLYILGTNGNVGIGATNPQVKLDVTGQVNIIGQTSNGTSHYQWDGGTYRNPGDHTPSLLVREDNSAADINGFKPALTLFNNDGSLNTTVGLAFVSRESNTGGNSVDLAGIMAIKESAGTSGGWSQGGLNFFVKNMGARVDALRILNSGNVGIGNTAPGTKLDVSGTFRNSLATTHSLLAGSGNVVVMADNSGTLYTSTAASSLLWSGSTGGNIWNANSGAVGIGTTAPSASLDVNGSVQFNKSDNVAKRFITNASRSVGANAGDYTYLGNISDTGLGTYATIYESHHDCGTINSATYEIKDVYYAGATTDWMQVPTHSYQSYNGGQDVAIDVRRTTNGGGFEVRIRNVGGPCGTVNSHVEIQTNGGFSPSATTGTGGTVAGYLASNVYQFPVANNRFTASTNGLFILNSGLIGIGKTNPAKNLDVVGDINASLTVNATGLCIGGVCKTDWNSLVPITGNVTLTGPLTIPGLSLTGDLDLTWHNIRNVTKLTVGTIDPLYNIHGVNYATFAPSIAGGVKEEYTGNAEIKSKNISGEYEFVVDFNKEKEGSDLWVWRHTVDFSKYNIQVLLTPYGKSAQIYYLIENDKLIFRANEPVEISYRLVGNRIDWKKWPTRALDQTEKPSFIIK
jgi:hypothetical protein